MNKYNSFAFTNITYKNKSGESSLIISLLLITNIYKNCS